ncbi:hypothetical protein ACLKA7_007671 [Drosophila subpalustris]
MVKEAILDKIREQRQGAVKPYFTGCSLRPGQNRALGKEIGGYSTGWTEGVELTFSEDPNSELKSLGQLKCLQANLHHAKTASDVLSTKNPFLGTNNDRLIYASEKQRPRAALVLNKKVTFVPLSQFTTEDLVAIWAKVPTACGEQEAVIASAYFPGESNGASPRGFGPTSKEEGVGPPEQSLMSREQFKERLSSDEHVDLLWLVETWISQLQILRNFPTTDIDRVVRLVSRNGL